jgi:hypothetical protein
LEIARPKRWEFQTLSGLETGTDDEPQIGLKLLIAGEEGWEPWAISARNGRTLIHLKRPIYDAPKRQKKVRRAAPSAADWKAIGRTPKRHAKTRARKERR